MLTPVDYKMESWQLNQVYDLIENCRVVPPPYVQDWFYWKEFALDKRLWLTHVITDSNKKFLDMHTINARDYFLYKEGTKHYIWTISSWSIVNITPTGFTVDADSPTRFIVGKSATWAKISSWAVVSPQTWMGPVDIPSIPGYSWGYVKFQYSWWAWLSVWSKLLFTSWILKGWVNEVLAIDGWFVYIIGTNIRWSVPEVWTTFDVYSSVWNAIVVWHTTWVSLVVINWTNEANVVNILNTTSPIIDIVRFDGNIFTATKNNLYFGRTTFDDNTMIHPLDNIPLNGIESLFPMGKAMIVFWLDNKIIAPATWTSATIWYVWYDANYSGKPYSKYSYIYTDSTIQILQKDKQLMEVNVQQSNSSTFDLVTRNVMAWSRWLFESFSWGQVIITSSDRFMKYIHIKEDWTSYIQEYDKQYQHWIGHSYSHHSIYGFKSIVYGNWFIANESWYTDNTHPYEQSVNFSYLWFPNIAQLTTVRTMFSLLIEEVFDIILDVIIEIWGRKIIKTFPLKSYVSDERLSPVATWDEVIWYDDWVWTTITYDGSFISVQNNINKTWRNFWIRYHSFNRFWIGQSLLLVSPTNKPYINEIGFSNYN